MSIEQTQEAADVKIALLEQRVNQHEVLLHDLAQIKTDLALLVQRFGNYQPPNCQVHQMRMDNQDRAIVDLDKKVEKMQLLADGIQKKIIFWTGIAAVIGALLTYVIVPVIIHHYTEPAAITQSN